MSTYTAMEGSAWHPLRCMTRTDCHAGSLYHSFYLIDSIDVEKQQIHVAIQVPSADRLNLDTVYAGLQLFVLDAVTSMLAAETAKKQEALALALMQERASAISGTAFTCPLEPPADEGVEADHFGTFVITGENASRHYCCWRGTPQRMFVAASAYPCMSFTRQVLDFVGLENQEDVLATLTGLCEAPVCPAVGLQYEFMFNQDRKVNIKISEGEQVDDAEIFMLATHVMNPSMIISAWEAIVLERKVLVKCSKPSLIAPCCEFFRRLVLPYVVVNTYVPVLSEQLLTAIEAPFPYLVGADTAILSKYPWIDLSDTVVIDLDSRMVTFPKYDSVRAPKSMVDRLSKEISAVYLRKFDTLLQRPFQTAFRVRENLSSPSRAVSLYADMGNAQIATEEANAVLSIFIRENIALTCARNNSLSAFLRQPSQTKFPDSLGLVKAKKPPADLEWGVSRGLTCGMMHLLDGTTGKIAVWVEANHLSLDVYQYADHLPYVVMRYKDIDSVAQNSGEPEGQIFQISLKNQTTLLFQIYYTENRHKWLALIDSYIKAARRREKLHAEGKDAEDGNAEHDGSQPMLEGEDESTGVEPFELSQQQEEGAGEAPTPSTKTSDKEDPFNFEDLLLPLPAVGSKEAAAAEAARPPNAIVAVAPQKPVDQTQTTSQREDAKIIQQAEEAEERETLQFRAAFMSTQMMSYAESQMVPESFESYLHKLGLTFEQSYVAQRDICSFQEKYLCDPQGGLVLDILKTTDEEFQGKGEIYDWTKRVPNNLNNSPLVSDDLELAHRENASGKLGGREDYMLHSVKSQMALTAAGSSVTDKEGHPSKRRSFFGAIGFGKSPRASDKEKVPVAATPLNAGDLASLEIQARAAREEERKVEAKQLLSRIVVSYRRCLTELRSSIVEDRVDVLAHLVQQNTYVRRGLVDQTPITLRIISPSSDLKPSSLGAAGKTSSGPERFPGSSSLRERGGSAGGEEVSASSEQRHERRPEGIANKSGSMGGQNNWLDHVWESLKPYELDGAGHTRKENAELYSSMTTNVRLDLLQQLEEQRVAGGKHLDPILKMCESHLYNEMDDIDNVLRAFKEGKLATMSRIMLCLCKRFVEQVKSQSFSTPVFLGWAQQFGNTISLQAYRLIMHLMYENVSAFYAHMSDSALDDSLVLDTKTKGIFGTTKSGDMMFNSDRSGISKTGRHDSPDTTFTWIENRSRKARETLNESVICSSSVNAARPIELSVYLATKARDLLTAYCSSPTGKLFAAMSMGRTKLDLDKARIKDIKQSSAFANFELQVCELQRVDLKSLRTNQLCVFFVNVHNTLALHATILAGSPGTTPLERNTFGQHKYTIGTGMMFSLFEMELAILRHKSKKANVYGYYQDASFRESDPRSAYRLSQPFPFLTFVLFTGTDASPPIVILREPDNLEAEFNTHAREYVRLYVRTRRENFTANVPGILRVYLEDFISASRSKNTSKSFMKMLITLAPDRLKSELEAIFMNKGGNVAVPRLLFDSLNWHPYIIL